jgi:hypothetical protein
MKGQQHGLSEVARIEYPTPKGSCTLEVFEGDLLHFGRGPACRIRFAHAPTADQSIPRVAGTLIAANGRLFVDSSSHVGHRALEIHTGKRKVQIPLGEGMSLTGDCDVVIRGYNRNWILHISVHAVSAVVRSDSRDELPTAHVKLELTEMQWMVLRAYYEPIRLGYHEPASHREVATALGFHLNTVRNKIYEIRDLMYVNGLQMPETKDARVAVIEATRIHGLLQE